MGRGGIWYEGGGGAWEGGGGGGVRKDWACAGEGGEVFCRGSDNSRLARSCE